MGISKPTSGGKITKQSVINMHDTVRANINAVEPQVIGPSSFGIPQMNTSSSPLVAFDFVNKDSTSAIVMNTFATDDQPTDVIPNWQELTAFKLDNNGQSFTTVGASQYVIYFTCQVTKAFLGATEVAPSEKIHVFFAVTFKDNLGNETVIQSSIMGYGLYSRKYQPPTTANGTKFFAQDIPVALWCSFNLPEGKIITDIKFYSCLLTGSFAHAGTISHVEITAGTSGCFVFERV
jgi:hypothetical protein